MGFFGGLFGKSDPTRRWVADPNLSLVCDLSRHALAGITLGQPVEALRGLGPPENPEAARREMYCYPSRGFEIDAEGGRVGSIVIDWEVPDEGSYREFGGSFVYQGRTLRLGPETGLVDFVQVFGEPYWRAQEAEELILFYEFGNGVEWQVEFTRALKLKGLLLVTPPLLADSDQREAYRVIRPWPPEVAGSSPRPPGPEAN